MDNSRSSLPFQELVTAFQDTLLATVGLSDLYPHIFSYYRRKGILFFPKFILNLSSSANPQRELQPSTLL